MDESLVPADYYEQTLVTDTAVSPGGDRVAFTATEFDAAEEESLSSLFVVPADGSREPHRLTRIPGVSSPSWSPDGSKLAFLAGRDADVELRAATTKDESEEEDEDEQETDDGEESEEDNEDEHGAEEQQVWVLDLARGGEPRQVTTREEGITSFDWGPEGDRIVVSSRDPTDEQREYLEEREDDGPIEIERLQHKANGRGWLDEVTTYLFVVDVESREERRLDDAYAGGAISALGYDGMQPAWAPSDRIAFVANHDDDADDSWALDCFTIDPAGETLRRITDGTIRASSPAWGPNGERLAFLAADPENNHVPTDLRVVDPGERDEVLTDDLDRTVVSCDWVDDDRVLGAVGVDGQTKLYEFDPDGERRDAFPEQDEDAGIYAGSMNTDVESGTTAFVGTGPNDQNVYRLADGEDDAARLTDVNADLFERSQLVCERVRFESEPGTEVEGYTYYAADEEPAEQPLVVNIHGGPMAYDEPSFDFGYHYWASEGYVVLEVNYRGSTSYGRAFSEAIRGDWGPREARDIAAGVEHLIDRGWVDPDRVFVTGFSQGGVNTVFVLEKTDVATAGAAEHGVYDFRSAFGTDDSHVWWENDFGLPWENPERYDESSSITSVDEIDAPLLVTAGEEDWRCPPSQAEQLYVAAKKCGVESKLVVYPGLGHAYGGPDVATHRLETITEWFREHDPTVTSDPDEDGSD